MYTVMLVITVIEVLVFSELWEYACLLVIIISFVILKLIALIENENKLLSNNQIVNAKDRLSIIQVILLFRLFY